MKTKSVHISTIKAGDTVIHNNEIKTVCNSNINKSEFMGISIFGDTYNLGYKKIQLIVKL